MVLLQISVRCLLLQLFFLKFTPVTLKLDYSLYLHLANDIYMKPIKTHYTALQSLHLFIVGGKITIPNYITYKYLKCTLKL